MNQDLPPDEAALLEEMKRSWAEQFRFFSNHAKEEREHWVVNEFLTHLGVSSSGTELRSHPQESKVDVEFREALFQVKEITDPNVKRGEEVKTTYRRVMAAQTLQDTVGQGFVYDVPAPASGYELIRDNAIKLAASAIYRDHARNLDLLCYITRTCTSLITAEQQRLHELAAVGWRSVSCLIGEQAIVLYAAADAPLFLRKAASSHNQR